MRALLLAMGALGAAAGAEAQLVAGKDAVRAPYSKDAPVLLHVRMIGAERLPGKVLFRADETGQQSRGSPPGRKWIVEQPLDGDGPMPEAWNDWLRFHSVIRGYQTADRVCAPECRVLAHDIAIKPILQALLGRMASDAASVRDMGAMGWLAGCWTRSPGKVSEQWDIVDGRMNGTHYPATGEPEPMEIRIAPGPSVVMKTMIVEHNTLRGSQPTTPQPEGILTALAATPTQIVFGRVYTFGGQASAASGLSYELMPDGSMVRRLGVSAHLSHAEEERLERCRDSQ